MRGENLVAAGFSLRLNRRYAWATLIPLQDGCSPVVLLLQEEQMLFMLRIFFQDQFKPVARRQVGTLRTMLDPAIDGAYSDGAAIQPPPASAPRAFGMGEKPLQTLAEFRQ